MRGVLALLFLSIRSVSAQLPVGSYYAGPGSILDGRCPIASCALNCSSWQYRDGCLFNSSGYCRDCTGLGADKYFSATGGLSNSCTQTSQQTCTAGFKNLNRNSSYRGDCTACAAPQAGFYFTTPTGPSDITCTSVAKTGCAAGSKDTTYSSITSNSVCVACSSVSTLVAGNYWKSTTPDQCVQESKSICPAGFRLSASDLASPTVKGTCIACDPSPEGFYYTNNSAPSSTCNSTQCIDTDCKIGEYKKFCNGTSAGQCSACTNGNSSSVYATTGGYNNNCQVQGCTKQCGIGKYIYGCGLALDQLSCKDCTNSVPNATYYTQPGAYDPNACPVTNCPVCSNGYYTSGCGGTNPGSCATCTNG